MPVLEPHRPGEAGAAWACRLWIALAEGACGSGRFAARTTGLMVRDLSCTPWQGMPSPMDAWPPSQGYASIGKTRYGCVYTVPRPGRQSCDPLAKCQAAGAVGIRAGPRHSGTEWAALGRWLLRRIVGQRCARQPVAAPMRAIDIKRA